MLQYRLGAVLPNVVMLQLTSEISIIPTYMQTNNTQALLPSIVIFRASSRTFRFRSSQSIPLSRRFLIHSEKQLLVSSCLSVCISASLTGQIFVKFDRGLLRKPVKEPQIWLISESGGGKNAGHFTRRLVFIVDSNIGSAAIQRTHCQVSMVTLSTFITLMIGTYVHQYKGKVFMLFHSNNRYTKES
jgi:hypothetical protein